MTNFTPLYNTSFGELQVPSRLQLFQIFCVRPLSLAAVDSLFQMQRNENVSSGIFSAATRSILLFSCLGGGWTLPFLFWSLPCFGIVLTLVPSFQAIASLFYFQHWLYRMLERSIVRLRTGISPRCKSHRPPCMASRSFACPTSRLKPLQFYPPVGCSALSQSGAVL